MFLIQRYIQRMEGKNCARIDLIFNSKFMGVRSVDRCLDFTLKQPSRGIDTHIGGRQNLNMCKLIIRKLYLRMGSFGIFVGPSVPCA